MATKRKKAVEEVLPPVDAPVEVSDEAVQVIADITADPVVEVMADCVLLEVHEREDGWWGARIIHPGFPEQNWHAPHRGGVEAAARRWLADEHIALPVQVAVV